MIDETEMAKIVIALFPEQKETLENNTDNNHVIGHCFASEAISRPMLESANTDKEKFSTYCRLLELLWRDGDDVVQDILDITILEDLQDYADDAVWDCFIRSVSEDFKKYVLHIYGQDVFRGAFPFC